MNKLKTLWQRLLSRLVQPCADDEEYTSELIGYGRRADKTTYKLYSGGEKR